MSDSPSRTNRVFDPCVKLRVMQRLDAGEALAALAREFGVARKVLYDWRAAWRAEGVEGFGKRRGPKPGWRRRRAEPPPDDPPGDPPGSAGALKAELAARDKRIAELERTVGRQQMGLDFFQGALQKLNVSPAAKPSAPARSTSSRP